MENILQGAFALSIAGTVGYLVKDIPYRIKEELQRQFTTTLTIDSHEMLYYKAISFLENHLKGINYRTIKLSNLKGDDRKEIKSVGLGYHIIKYKGKRLYLTLYKSTSDKRIIYTISITSLGRSHKLLDSLIEDIKRDCNPNELNVLSFCYGWKHIKTIPKRKSIILEKEKLDKLEDTLTRFKENKQLYVDNDMPYQLGIMLHGEAGNGKTSLIKYIASILDYPIYYLPVSEIIEITRAVQEMPPNTLFVIEDIDGSKSAIDRDTETIVETRVSDLLNAIDGILAKEGRVFVTTTNHINKLDKALTRAGRIDLSLELTNLDTVKFNIFTEKVFGISSKLAIKENICMAKLQEYLLEGLTYEQICERVAKN